MPPSFRWALRLSRTEKSSVRSLSATTRLQLERQSKIPKRALPRVTTPKSSLVTNKSPGSLASPQTSQTPSSKPPPDPNAVSNVLRAAAQNDHNTLLTPVYIPDDPDGVLRSDHPAFSILENSSVVIHRQLEMMNVLVGFEQANKYVIMDAAGAHIGYLIEQDLGVGKKLARQMLRTHRSFTTHVLDRNMREVLRVSLL